MKGASKRFTVQRKSDGKYLEIQQVPAPGIEYYNELVFVDEPVMIRHYEMDTIIRFMMNSLVKRGALPVGDSMELEIKRVR